MQVPPVPALERRGGAHPPARVGALAIARSYRIEEPRIGATTKVSGEEERRSGIAPREAGRDVQAHDAVSRSPWHRVWQRGGLQVGRCEARSRFLRGDAGERREIDGARLDAESRRSDANRRKLEEGRGEPLERGARFGTEQSAIRKCPVWNPDVLENRDIRAGRDRPARPDAAGVRAQRVQVAVQLRRWIDVRHQGRVGRNRPLRGNIPAGDRRYDDRSGPRREGRRSRGQAGWRSRHRTSRGAPGESRARRSWTRSTSSTPLVPSSGAYRNSPAYRGPTTDR
jgi:hypothetical protein